MSNDDERSWEPAFAGFSVPRYTQVPDELFDVLLAELSHADLKVLLYIIRHTLGYKRDGDHISARQIAEGIVKRDGSRVDSGTGCDISTVRRSIQRLEAKGLITVTRDQANDGGSAVNYYSLRWAEGEGGGVAATPPWWRQDTPPGVAATPGGVSRRHPQDKTSRKDSRDLSLQARALATEFLAAIGERRPAAKRRERAVRVIEGLIAEGFTEVELRAAFELAAERGALGPGLLPHVIGIAATQAKEQAARDRIVALAVGESQERSIQDRLASLTEAQRQTLEQRARAYLPAGVSVELASALLPGIMAGIAPADSRQ